MFEQYKQTKNVKFLSLTASRLSNFQKCFPSASLTFLGTAQNPLAKRQMSAPSLIQSFSNKYVKQPPVGVL